MELRRTGQDGQVDTKKDERTESNLDWEQHWVLVSATTVRRTGIKICSSGECVWTCDSDDFVHDNEWEEERMGKLNRYQLDGTVM